MTTKQFIIPISLLAISGLLMYGTVTARASDTKSWKDSFVSAIASKLGVDQSKVETAVSEVRVERREEMKKRYEERLDELVKLGKITEAQKSAIIAKKAELQKEWDADQVKREEHREEMSKWASDNGIDLSVVGPIGFGEGRGMGMGRGMER